jgi:hypothetical protein
MLGPALNVNDMGFKMQVKHAMGSIHQLQAAVG